MIWDVITGEEAWIGRQFPVWFPLVAWSPDGKRLACGGDDGIVYILNVTEDSPEQRLLGHHSRISCLAWSPDGKTLASGARGAEDGELFIWDVHSGQRLHSLVGHVGVVSAVAWDASGERLISGGGQGILRWWDVQRGEHLWEREAHNGTVQSLRRSPDGTKLASCGDDGTIMLWDLQSGEHLQTLRRDRPYERLNITGIRGLTEAQRANLRALGAAENDIASFPSHLP
jgi:WD40 repeat protein